MGKRNKVLAFVVISVFILTTFFPAAVIAAEDTNSALNTSSLLETFKNPPLELKSRPLWFWNVNSANELSAETIQEIMQNSRDQSGYSGFGILPFWIDGYLTEEYFARYGDALKKAKELGMKMTLYDENGFPSGPAGGLLAAQYPDAVAKRLDMIAEDVQGPVNYKKAIPQGTFMGAVAMNNGTKERIDISNYVHIAASNGPKVTASSTFFQPRYEPEKAVDGDLNSRWNAASNSGVDEWLEIDFGMEKTFNKTIIREALDRITGYSVQYWDGTKWIDCAEGTTIGAEKLHTFDTLKVMDNE